MKVSFISSKITWIVYALSGTIIFITFIFTKNIKIVNGIPINKEFYMTLGLSLFLAFSVPSLIEYMRYRERQLIDREVPIVLTEITESINSGLMMREALERVSTYASTPLRKELQQIVAKIYLGVNIYEALDLAYNRLRTQLSRKFIRVLKESLISGSSTTENLKVAANLYRELTLFEDTKKNEIRPYTFVIYLSFIIYLFIAYVTVTQFIKAISSFSKISAFSLGITNPIFYSALFFYIGLVQAIFGGFIIGKLYAGSIKIGALHSTIMIAILLTFYLFFMT